MKKFALLLLLTMLFPITFGCAKNKAEPDYSIVTYYGSVQKTEENSGLYVYIPTIGLCGIPSTEGVRPNLKDGDLIKMDFLKSEFEVGETHPATIRARAQSITVEKENVWMKVVDNQLILTLKNDKELSVELLSYGKDVGDDVHFIKYGVLDGTGVSATDYCTATIEDITEDKISLRVHFGLTSIHEFLKNLANRTLGIEGKSATEPSNLKNFFILKEFLTKNDILAVETVIEAGSISPEYRAPTEKKTSTSPYDIDVVFNYLNSLDFNTLTPVSEVDATVEGGDGKVLTVHTKFGTFKIQQIARKFLKVWDKYFILEQEVPYIAGESTTYTFTLDYTDATLYIDGIKFEEYNLNFKDLVCEVSEKTFVMEHHYVLQTCIGDLLILDSKHFKRHGMTYKIINNESFSSIFIDHPITEDLLILLKYLYQVKEQQVNPNVGNGIVVDYYGKYSSGAIVSIMTCEGISYPAVISSESVGKYGVNFYYPDTNAITVLYEGEFHSLSKAYEDGYLTDGDLFSIYYLHSNNYPALYNQDVLPIANGKKLKLYTTRHEKSVNYDSQTEYPVVKIIRTATEYFTYSAQEKVTSVYYGEGFFEEYNLLAIKVKTTNAAESYAVSGIYALDSGQYSIWLTDKGTDVGATVMGVQYCFIGVPKAERITESNLEVIFYDFWWM